MKVVLINPPHTAIGNEATHWVEVVDGQGLFPIQRLGPYATARLAARAHRGALRLLNVARYSVAVVSRPELEGRQQSDEAVSG